MTLISARSLRVASLAILAIASRGARAQSTSPVSIMLMVPVQVTNLDPKVTKIRVHCTAQPVGVAVKVTFAQDFADAGPVVNGGFSGSTQVELKGTSTQRLAPGQKWSYQCHSDFVTSAVGAKSGDMTITPGGTGAALAPKSPPNLIEGTFTTQ